MIRWLEHLSYKKKAKKFMAVQPREQKYLGRPSGTQRMLGMYFQYSKRACKNVVDGLCQGV